MSPEEIIYGYGLYPRGKLIKFRPAILIPFKHLTLDIEIQLDALIDSGADCSVSFREIGEQLGIKFEGKPKEEIGLVGNVIMGWKAPIQFRIGDNVIECDVRWADEKFDSENDFSFILGRDGLFEMFDIEFTRNKRIVFRS